MADSSGIIVRIAPSPTGFFHMGTLRTALFNYLYAKRHGGSYLLRIEDTDKIRSKKEYEDDILASLEWLGITHDAFFRQSEHLDNHRGFLQELIASGKAYASKEESKENPGEMREVIRFKNPNGVVTFTDLILGEISVDTTDLGDFIIAKDMDTPLYNFAVVVDDIEAGITHVIRGQDHVSNTPRQILLYRALGKPEPKFAHIPLILAPDKQKLSKRKHGESVSVRHYREKGYLPEALINFMALIGWNPGTDQELFSLAELTGVFDLDRVQKSPGVFNVEKLDWINKEHIKRLSTAEQERRIREFLPETLREKPGYSDGMISTLVPLIVDRIAKFGDVRDMCETGELDMFFAAPNPDTEKINFKGTAPSDTKTHLEKAADILSGIEAGDWDMDMIKDRLMQYADTLEKRGAVLHPVRYALSGREQSPDPFTIAAIIGKTETLARLASATASLG